MKFSFSIAILLLLAFSSCDNRSTEEEKKQVPEVPKALEEKNDASYDLVYSKRGSGNLVENLYAELVEKTPALKALEDQLTLLPEARRDSTEAFLRYQERNQTFYSDAERSLLQIQDSVLRAKTRLLLTSSLAKYNINVAPHNALLQSLDNKTLTLNDLHVVLKITSTLAVMENYQRENLPSTKPMEGFSRQLDKAIKETEGLSK